MRNFAIYAHLQNAYAYVMRKNYVHIEVALRVVECGRGLLVSSVVIPMKVMESSVEVEPFDVVKSADGEDHFDITFE